MIGEHGDCEDCGFAAPDDQEGVRSPADETDVAGLADELRQARVEKVASFRQWVGDNADELKRIIDDQKSQGRDPHGWMPKEARVFMKSISLMRCARLEPRSLTV